MLSNRTPNKKNRIHCYWCSAYFRQLVEAKYVKTWDNLKIRSELGAQPDLPNKCAHIQATETRAAEHHCQ